MHRFFIPPALLERSRVILPDHVAHQVRTVLRMHPNDQIILLDGNGMTYTARITSISREQVTVEIVESARAEGEPETYIALYQAALKKDHFEWALEKGTEIGVSAFVPIITARCIPREIDENKLERWGRIITEAAEQCGRGIIPELSQPMAFEDIFDQFADFDLCLILDTRPDAPTLGDVIGDFRAEFEDVPAVALIVGPEGDFTPEEMAAAIRAGAKPASIGPRILRAETAGIAAAAMLIYEWEL
jgi:16S rRNA (uracil1498-N3)-methyltransferase